MALASDNQQASLTLRWEIPTVVDTNKIDVSIVSGKFPKKNSVYLFAFCDKNLAK